MGGGGGEGRGEQSQFATRVLSGRSLQSELVLLKYTVTMTASSEIPAFTRTRLSESAHHSVGSHYREFTLSCRLSVH